MKDLTGSNNGSATWQTPGEAQTWPAGTPADELRPIATPPMVDLADLGADLQWSFLTQPVPADLHVVALHLAQVTLGMAMLKQRIEELEAINEARAFEGCGLARGPGSAD